jgi:hypothetical protein
MFLYGDGYRLCKDRPLQEPLRSLDEAGTRKSYQQLDFRSLTDR